MPVGAGMTRSPGGPRVRKNVYYFAAYGSAHDYALANQWPTDRIISFELGWAIQLACSGAYVGPSSAADRVHADLMRRRNLASS